MTLLVLLSTFTKGTVNSMLSVNRFAWYYYVMEDILCMRQEGMKVPLPKDDGSQ